jgi:hypothetical protein
MITKSVVFNVGFFIFKILKLSNFVYQI